MKKLAIYTDSKIYSDKLCDYLQGHVFNEYSVGIFTEEDELYKQLKDGKLSLLLIQETKYKSLKKRAEQDEFRIENAVLKIICLYEDDCLYENESDIRDNNTVCLYMYLPASSIVAEILSDSEDLLYSKRSNENDKPCKIIGVYSPIGGIGTTTLSLALAKEDSKKNRVLFIDLEVFSPVGEMLYVDETISLAEIIYDFSSNNKLKQSVLNKYVQDAEGFSTIAPFRNIIELSTLSADIWNGFVSGIAKSGSFDEVIVCISDLVNDLFGIINNCEEVIIPYREGVISRRKLELFDSQLKGEMSNQKYERIVRFVEYPYFVNQEDRYEELETTDVGKWIRRLRGNC